jgi:outer membrane lipoprotein carrier protein
MLKHRTHKRAGVLRRREILGKATGALTVALLCNLAGALRAQAPAPTSDAYVQQFEASYRQVRSLRAQFTQTYTAGGRTRVETGRVAFERGGLMRWDYQTPEDKLFVSDGKEVQLYIPDAHQVTRSSVKMSEDFRVPFELLLTRLNLHKVFSRVELDDVGLDHAPGDHVLQAFPKKEFAEDYQSVLIELDPQFDIRRLVVNYPDHSRMDFRFEHIERNPPLPRSLFQFTPPAGTEIIDQH